MRDAKSSARGVDELALQVALGGESDAVHQPVQHAVARLQLLEEPRDLFILRDVAHETRGPGKLGDEIFRFELEAFVLISDSQAPARLLQLLRDGPGDPAFVCPAKYHCCLLRLRHSLALQNAYLAVGAAKSNSVKSLLNLFYGITQHHRPAVRAAHRAIRFRERPEQPFH